MAAAVLMSSSWLLLVVLMFTMIGITENLANIPEMNKFNSLIEKDTCNIDWPSVRSIWVNQDNKLEAFILKDGSHFFREMNIRKKPNKPIYHVNYHNGTNVPVKTSVMSEKLFKKETFDNKQIRIFPLDFDTNHYIFTNYNFNEKVDCIAILFMDPNDGGAKSNLYTGFKAKQGFLPLTLPNLKHPLLEYHFTFIGFQSIQYKYSHFKMEKQAKINVPFIYYFGFDQKLDSIYFGPDPNTLGSLSAIHNSVPASKLFSDVNAQRFVFYHDGFVYLIYDQWVFLFAYIDLNVTLSGWGNERPFFKSPLSVMHVNTFFRCVTTKSSVPKPTYPSGNSKIISNGLIGNENQTEMLVNDFYGDDGNYFSGQNLMIGGGVAGIIIIAGAIYCRFVRKSNNKLPANNNQDNRLSTGNSKMSTISPDSPGSRFNSRLQSKLGGGGGGGSKVGSKFQSRATSHT